MRRRRFISLSAAATLGAAGCSSQQQSSPTATAGIPGPRSSDDLPADETPQDGYPPAFETTPEPQSFDVENFETTVQDGEDVPLAPIEVAYHWYARGAARFADARGSGQYEDAHILGAVWSPARGTVEDDPVLEWAKSDRIVCYCGCPHHLSSIRAAALMQRGYENVYVIDEGFWEWTDRNYPVVGSDVEGRPSLYTIVGTVDQKFAGETAWVAHRPTDQLEATAIDERGRYELHVRFADVEPTTAVTLETPAYRTVATLSSLSGAVVDG